VHNRLARTRGTPAGFIMGSARPSGNPTFLPSGYQCGTRAVCSRTYYEMSAARKHMCAAAVRSRAAPLVSFGALRPQLEFDTNHVQCARRWVTVV